MNTPPQSPSGQLASRPEQSQTANLLAVQAKPFSPEEITSTYPVASVAPARTKRIKHRRWWLMATLASLGLLGSVGVYLVTRPSLTTSDLASQTALANTQPLNVQFEASGSVEPIHTVNISPKNTGRLAALYVDQGDTVKAGQILARMDVGDLEAQLAQAKAKLVQAEARYAQTRNGSRQEEISQARAQVESAQAQADLTAVQVTRYRNLESQGAIAKYELDQAISEDRSARASLKERQEQLQQQVRGSRPEEITQAGAEVDAARAEVALYQRQLGDTVLKAPFDGLVTQRYATEGAIVTPTTSASATASATSTSILAVASGLEANVNVTEATIAQVTKGQRVEVVADAYPNQTFEGRVKQIAPEAVSENNVTSFEVIVELLSGLSDLRSGMTVNVTFIGASIPKALIVPTVSITTQNGQLGVMRADVEGNATFQPVRTGVSQAGQTQILEGLQEGERVFIDEPNNDAIGARGRGPTP